MISLLEHCHGEKRCMDMNDFDKPKDQRELAHLGLVRNRTLKNMFSELLYTGTISFYN